MASKDTHSSCVDGIKVKISEQYKPPPRIILPVSYSQRLTMNDQIRRSMFQYDFNGERSIKSSLVEWKTARKLKQEERQSNFEACTQEMKLIDENEVLVKNEERLKKEQQEETENQATTVANEYSVTSTVQNIPNNILIPTIAGLNTQPHSSLLDKSPFNVYDFDPDTSSPFDNMALKSINDLEELALVLNKDKVKSQQSQSNQQQMSIPQASYQMYYNDQQHNAYVNRNGYYQHDMRTLTQPQVNVNHSYSYPPGSYDHQQLTTSHLPTSQSSVADHRSTPTPSTTANPTTQHSSVPLYIRSIQQQLGNTHIHHHLTVGAGATVSSSHSKQNRIVEQLGNPYGGLEADAQAMCRGISSMGFPLARVARACDLIGNDDKKIVEYLLVMSDLMDLGFSETSVSTALVKCNNDKDKALEVLLIS